MGTRIEASERQDLRELSATLRAHRDEILQRWLALRRQAPRAGTLSEKQLIDHVPHLLDDLADAVDRPAPEGTPGDMIADSDAHALDRLNEGFSLPDLTEEYGLLRRVILATFHERAPQLVAPGIEVVLTQIDRSLTESVGHFERIRHRTLEALDQVSRAALGNDEVAIVLDRMLQVIANTMPAVDSVTLLLKEGDRLRVRAAVGLTEERDHEFSVGLGEGFAGKVAELGKPLLLRSAATDPLIRSEFLRARGTRALYGVPLWRGTELMGVAHMGSTSAFEFAQEDLLLFRIMSERAAGLIHQAELVEKERRVRAELEAIFEAVPAGIYVGDSSGVHRTNRAGLRMLGLERAEQLEADVASLARLIQTRHLDGRPMSAEEQVFTQALQGRPATRDVLVHQVQSGQERIVHSSAAPIRDAAGAVSGAVAVNTDVTERYRAEAQLKENEERLRLALEAGELGTWEFDLGTRAIHGAGDFARIFGMAAGESLIPEALLERVHAEDRETLHQAGARATAPGAEGRLTFECRIRRGDGVERWISVRGQVVFDDVGKPRRIVGVVHDVSDAKRAAQFQGRLLGIVSHDLRSPLTVILSSAQVLLTHVDAPNWVAAGAARIRRNGDQMTRMISDLMDFTRIRALGAMPIERKPMDLGAWLAERVDELAIPNPGRLHLSHPAEAIPGHWDPDRLAQVVSNLVSNALHHGSPETPIQVGLETRPEGRVRLWVRNQGNPIPMSDREAIFDPFRKALDARHASGLGLGLHIVQEIARAHGGTTEVSSSPTEGTTFVVDLPREPD